MRVDFERVTYLEYQLQAYKKRIKAFESGEKYLQMQEAYSSLLRCHNRDMAHKEAELAEAHRETVSARNHWFEVYEDVEKECQRKLKLLLVELDRKDRLITTLTKQRDEFAEKLHQRNLLYYKIAGELDEEKEKNRKLTAQVNMDFENSSIPSSMQIKKKKITNNREKTGRKPGGQPGHEGHRRKKQAPTEAPILLLPPQEILDDPDLKKTNKTIVKQAVDIHVSLDVREYHAPVYYNSKTGERVHGEFPAGVVDDVNYLGGIKAFLFLLNNECCASIDKSRRFLSDLTGGKLNISKGMVNKLSHEFSEKTKAEREKIFADLLLSPVMHTDCTGARVNGKSVSVFVCASPDGKILYFAREHKGHEGVKGTPVENYVGTLIHDHESTFYSYGLKHQECLAHILRYLKGSMENEPERKWSGQMHALIREMIHYRNGLPPDRQCDPEKIRDFESRYLEILQKGEEEYKDIPPSEYYKEGYNLCRRMKEYMAAHLLFLHDSMVPTTNNLSERLLRNYKRKQKQAVSFRGFENIEDLCDSMSMLIMMRQNMEENMFSKVSEIFA